MLTAHSSHLSETSLLKESDRTMSKLFAPLPLPKSKLGVYRKLSSTAGVRVSPICLGGMSIGDKWAEGGMGSMNKEDSFKLLDAYYDLGGNFIDTANF